MLVEHIKDIDDIYQDISSLDYERTVSEYKNRPEFVRGFLLAVTRLRAPESTPTVLARAFKKRVLAKFHSILKDVQQT